MKRRLHGVAAGAATGLAGVAGASAQTALQDRFFGGDEGSTDTVSAGNGGVATASSNGGAIGAGDINSGGNAGNAIGVGDTAGGGVGVDGGTVGNLDRSRSQQRWRHLDRRCLRRRLQPRLRQLAHRAERRPRTSQPPLSTARMNHENPPGCDRLAASPAGHFIVRRTGTGQILSINAPGMLSPWAPTLDVAPHAREQRWRRVNA